MNNFLSENYSEIQLMAKKICKSHHEWEDVCSYSIEKFMFHERAQEFVDQGVAMKFLSGIMHRSFYSSTSSYHYDIRQKGVMHTIKPDAENLHQTQEYDPLRDKITSEIHLILEEMITSSKETWFIAVLFQTWLVTPNFSQIARETGVPRTSVSRACEEAKQYIKIELKKRGYDDFQF